MMAVHKSNICTTDTWIYSVWEPTQLAGAHHTIMHGSDLGLEHISAWWGDIMSRDLPPDIDGIDARTRLDERIHACREYRRSMCRTAWHIIERAYPGLSNCRYDEDGEVWETVPGTRDRLKAQHWHGSSQTRTVES